MLEKVYAHFLENKAGILHTLLLENEEGQVARFLNSVKHPGSCLLGPGVSRSEEIAAALIHAQLNSPGGGSPVLIVPVTNTNLVQTLYRWGAKNCELPFCQVRGEFQPFKGINIPTFLPETG